MSGQKLNSAIFSDVDVHGKEKRKKVTEWGLELMALWQSLHHRPAL